jgi:hypothetical protein
MQCPHCQHENRETARFCAACGHAFAVNCAVCSNPNPPDAAFCDNCGTRLARPTSEPPSVHPQARASRPPAAGLCMWRLDGY